MRFKHLIISASLLIFAAACVDKSFDITNIGGDATIGGSEFTLPLGRTDTMRMSKFISDTSLLSVVDGVYAIVLKDSIVESLPVIDPITVDIPSSSQSSDIEAPDVNFSTFPKTSITDTYNGSVGGIPSGVALPSNVYTGLKFDDEAVAVSIDYTPESEVNKINYVLFGDDASGAEVSFAVELTSLHTTLGGVGSGNYEDTVRNLSITFPEGFELSANPVSNGSVSGRTFSVNNLRVTDSTDARFSFYVKRLDLNLTGAINYNENVVYSLDYGLFIKQGTNVSGSTNLDVDVKADLELRDANITTNSIEVPIDASTININSGTVTISEEVKRIDTLWFKDGNSTLNFSISDPSLPLSFAAGENLYIDFPPLFKFKSGQGVDASNRYSIPSDNLFGTKLLEIDYLFIGKTVTPGMTLVNENIEMPACTLHMAPKTLMVSELGTNMTGKSVDISVENGSLEVGSVAGKIEPTIDPQQNTVDMTDIPDFLRGDSVNLSLKNPNIKISILNPVGIPFEIAADMIAKDNMSTPIPGSSINTTLDIARAQSGQAQWSNFYLASSIEGMPAGYIYKSENISDLIRKVPYSIDVNMGVSVTGETQRVDLTGKEDTLKVNYDINIPLDFNADFQIQYKDTIDDLMSSLSDIVEYATSLDLVAVIYNTIPLDLGVGFVGINSEGAPVDVKIEIDEVIKAGTLENPQVTKFNVIMHEQSEGALKAMDAILIDVHAKANTSTSGEALKAAQYVYLELKVKVPDGITISLKSDD